MRRREFVGLLGGAAASSYLLPLATRAQQTAKLPVVGFFHSGDGEDASAFRVAAFRQGLNEAG